MYAGFQKMIPLPVPELSIVVPTFNERDNVGALIGLVDATLQGIDWDIIFVDDDSRDGTADEVRCLAESDPRIHLVHRIGRKGLAGACIEGILSSIAPLVAVMDADLQHDETRLVEMLAILRRDPTIDMVIGSRNIEGGSAGHGLSPLRKWGSDRTNKLAQSLLGIGVSDPMSGFFMVRRRAFNEVACQLQGQGFKILTDMLSASCNRWKVVEIPYTFRERIAGLSKMSPGVSLEFLALLVSRLTGGALPLRLVLFLFVGLSGLVVQLAVVRAAMLVVGGGFPFDQALGVFVAMGSNYVLNNRITYRDRRLKGRAFIRGLISFYVVCTFGALSNVAVATIVFRLVPVWFIASVSGAVVGALWNFWASLIFTWRAR